MERRTVAGLQVDQGLHDFITQEALPGTGITAEALWPVFAVPGVDAGLQGVALIEQGAVARDVLVQQGGEG